MKGMFKLKKIGLILLVCTLCVSLLCACGDSANKENKASVSEPQKVLVTMEDGSTFTIKTEPQFAPETCENFINLVNEGFYDGLTFHRVLDDFVAQGGDPKGDGTGGSEKKIYGEFAENGFDQNTLSHTRGVVSMARSNAPDSASSQFFICYTTLNFLDGSYAAFGEVIDGMETVDGFLNTSRNDRGMPETPIVIKEMKVID